jgi:hypothetical protein
LFWRRRSWRARCWHQGGSSPCCLSPHRKITGQESQRWLDLILWQTHSEIMTLIYPWWQSPHDLITP